MEQGCLSEYKKYLFPIGLILLIIGLIINLTEYKYYSGLFYILSLPVLMASIVIYIIDIYDKKNENKIMDYKKIKIKTIIEFHISKIIKDSRFQDYPVSEIEIENFKFGKNELSSFMYLMPIEILEKIIEIKKHG